MRQSQIGIARLGSDQLSPDAFKTMGALMKASLNSSDDSLLQKILRGDEVYRDSLRNQLPEGRFAEFCASKLFIESGERVYSPFRTHLLEEFVIVTDPPGRPRGTQGELYLDPLCEAPQLAKLLIRKAGGRGLDMGCGSGVLSLVLSSFCEHVTGVDINPRALEVSHFNSALNGVNNVTIIESDLFSALGKQQFDHIVFNSPTNEEGDCYRDLLEAGESLLTRFFTQLASHLTPRGYCQINFAMNDYKDSYFWDRLRNWIRADRDDLWWVAMVCQRRQFENDHVWKRAWSTFCRGSCSSAEVDWPYKLLPMTVRPEAISGVVLRLLENHRLLDSGKQLAHLTWSEGVRYSAQNSTLSLWDVPLVEEVPEKLLSSFRHNESLAFPTLRDVDFWIEQSLRKGLLRVLHSLSD
jgi:methylase of polypeptide subunit release factors